jgi:CRP-like cAMP-binding protein
MIAPAHPALERFLARLMLRSNLSAAEQAAVLSLNAQPIEVSARRDVVMPGRTVDYSCLIASGWAARFDQMRDGQRQITAFYIAGDMCDLHSVVAPTAGWGIAALTDTTILKIAHSALRGTVDAFPNLALAYWRDTTADASILAKWIANIGRADAEARVAHLLCELAIRIEHAGLSSRTAYALRLTQEQIADAVGLTAVHVNRMLRNLRHAGSAAVQNHAVEVLDWQRLTDTAAFDPAYMLMRQLSDR